MPAFFVFTRERTLDPAALKTYSETVGPSFDGRAVKFLATGGKHEVLEGAPIESAVILEFPDTAAAKAWYDSPAYQAALTHRFQGAEYRGFIVEGR